MEVRHQRREGEPALGGVARREHRHTRPAGALRLAAWGLMRSTSYLGAFLRRQRSRLGSQKAVTATAHKRARIVYHLMRFGMGYVKQTEDAYAEQVRERLEKQLRRRAKELGFEVTKVQTPRAVASVPELG